ncbi:MAG: PAS domain S-box protein, partial [Planctomycetes bacterium]|nr:PAS domain S-box protein [Planctomycetota bacterium]
MNMPHDANVSRDAGGEKTLQKVDVKALLEHLPVAAYACDRDGLITYYNQYAEQVWGRRPKLNDPADRYCGAHRHYLADGTPVPHTECWIAQALRENKALLGKEIIIEQPDGKRLAVLAHANPIHSEAGELVGAVNIIVDITERKSALLACQQAEAALRHSEERFR